MGSIRIYNLARKTTLKTEINENLVKANLNACILVDGVLAAMNYAVLQLMFCLVLWIYESGMPFLTMTDIICEKKKFD